MNILKVSFIFVLVAVFIGSFIPEASAKKYCRSRSSFGLSFNIGTPTYAVAATPVVTPVPAVASVPVTPVPVFAPVAPVVVSPYRTAVVPVNAYPYGYYQGYYATPVVVQQPISRAYAQPTFSYSYWHR